jgi:hypothetical protein
LAALTAIQNNTDRNCLEKRWLTRPRRRLEDNIKYDGKKRIYDEKKYV